MPDILIRMEMPQNCFNCSTKVDPDNRRCNIDGHVFEETLSKLTCRRDEHCPLQELSEHGDLIDRSELKTNMIDDTFGSAARYVNIMQILNAPVIVPSNKEDTK